MIFGEKTEEQKRVAELTREVKELRKELLASKLDKKQVEVQMKDLKDALELGGNLRQGYVDSQEHMAVARRGLINMMEDMNEIPIEDVKRDLDTKNSSAAASAGRIMAKQSSSMISSVSGCAIGNSFSKMFRRTEESTVT